MKRRSVHNLLKGINLEKSQTLIPWKTSFSKLSGFGKAESKNLSGKRMITWKNEEILNGISVDLHVMLEEGSEDMNQRLRSVSAYISESDFKKARLQLQAELKQKGKYEKQNELEYSYTWKVNGCNVSLSHVDRFGSYWKLEIRKQESLFGQFRKIGFSGLCITFTKNFLNNNNILLQMHIPKAQLLAVG
jgi:hypothetical protein